MLVHHRANLTSYLDEVRVPQAPPRDSVSMISKPWRWWNGQNLDRWHQACVRLIRADFCGDGTPYTVNGQRVNVYDGIGIQQDTRWDWLIEAEWDEKGARCFNPVNRSHSLVPCFNDRALAVCGLWLDFRLGALLMNETPLPILQ